MSFLMNWYFFKIMNCPSLPLLSSLPILCDLSGATEDFMFSICMMCFSITYFQPVHSFNLSCVLWKRNIIMLLFSSVQSLSHVWLCDPMNRSMPGLPVHHQLPESTQTHVHWVGDAIQPSYPLSSPSPPALNLCQHQGLFKWVGSLQQVAKLLEFQL